jgi:hypothetical protein
MPGVTVEAFLDDRLETHRHGRMAKEPETSRSKGVISAQARESFRPRAELARKIHDPPKRFALVAARPNDDLALANRDVRARASAARTKPAPARKNKAVAAKTEPMMLMRVLLVSMTPTQRPGDHYRSNFAVDPL